MTQQEIADLLHTLEVFPFPENDDPFIEDRFRETEQAIGCTLAESYKICMRAFSEIESAYRHILPPYQVSVFTEIERKDEGLELPNYYVIEYQDDITILQNSDGEIFLSCGNTPIKYTDNLEKFLRETWNDDLIKVIKENCTYSTDTPYTLEEIQEAELVLGISFSGAFREYLRTFSHVAKGDRRLLTLLEVVEETLKARKIDYMFPKNCYIIELIKDEYKTITQNTMCTIEAHQPYKNKSSYGFSLANYIRDEM